MYNFYDIARQLKRNSGHRVTIDWRLDAHTAGNVIIDVGEKRDVVRAYAFTEQSLPFAEMERLYKADGPIDAIGMGYKRTKTFILQTYVTLQRLIGGLVSPKQLMGPVGILTFSYNIVAAQPFIYYVYFLGLISASIAVLNFLPVPPFDGGLTVLLLVEKIKGSAISVRTQEAIAYAAWGMLIVLIVYVTYNDILRIIFGFFRRLKAVLSPAIAHILLLSACGFPGQTVSVPPAGCRDMPPMKVFPSLRVYQSSLSLPESFLIYK